MEADIDELIFKCYSILKQCKAVRTFKTTVDVSRVTHHKGKSFEHIHIFSYFSV